eukprot:TRINITY_DN590_c0_g1_i3.p1 TRINITY_DN590_c0_g1~~TRINITY_DN590_c0_g1_i3.p1  ORF type:complete len:313 (+),score=33.49 TRINITY_DN590_c0_g1_i3:151-1089(+)
MKLFCCMFNKIEAAKLDFEKSWVFMFNGHVVTKVELMGTVSSIRMSSRGIWEIIIMDETSKAFCTRARDLEEKINLGDLVMCHGSVTKARPWLRSKVQNELCLFSIQKVSDANAEIEWMHDVMKTTAAHSAHPRETIIGSRKQTIGELFEHWGGHIRSSGNSFTMQDSLGILVLEVLSRYGGKKCFLNLIMLKSQLDNALGKNASLLIKILRTLNNYGDVVFSDSPPWKFSKDSLEAFSCGIRIITRQFLADILQSNDYRIDVCHMLLPSVKKERWLRVQQWAKCSKTSVVCDSHPVTSSDSGNTSSDSELE